MDNDATFGQRLADRIASFGGSWTFLIIFLAFIFAWMAINLYWLTKPFDPYPFILLNLFLSCVAAIQAPIIMMSQNRMSTVDREREELDLKVDIAAEANIRELMVKVDKIINILEENRINLL